MLLSVVITPWHGEPVDFEGPGVFSPPEAASGLADKIGEFTRKWDKVKPNSKSDNSEESVEETSGS